MKNYLCKPKRNDRSTKTICFSLLILSVLSFYLSARFPLFKAIGQLLSVLLLLLFVQITTKYLLTDYRYGFEDGSLLLSSRQGKKEKNLGSLPLQNTCMLFDQKAWLEEKAKHKITHRFSYCQNLFPKKPYYLLSPEGEGFVLLVFEPDETLLTILSGICMVTDAGRKM